MYINTILWILYDPTLSKTSAEARQTTQEQAHKNALRAHLSRYPQKALFHIKSADQWLKDEAGKPDARQLLGSLWYEHELCILFADTNLGKSVLAVQIGYRLAKRSAMSPFGCQVTEALKVLYIDFELTPAQFKARYTDSTQGAHHFSENFIRAEFNPGGDDPLLYDNYEDYVQRKIDTAISDTKANVLIIDNITCMGSATSHAGGALPLIKALKALKAKYKLSVLVLAHTPKRNPLKPISNNDLQGSKMIINFADSAFAIGQSHRDLALRYIKQIKQRNTASDYGEAHICLFSIVKQYSFLMFQFEGYDNEHFHLQKVIPAITDEIKLRIAELNRQGLSQRQIADHLKISATSVRRILTRQKEENGEM